MFIIKYKVRTLGHKMVVINAETRREAIDKFFIAKAKCFYDENGSISIDEVVNVSKLKVIE